jgi:biotin transporter BioY
MITAPEVARALYGALRLARLDPGGIDQFDNTVEAFWRSFYAMLIVAPGHVILAAIRYSVVEPTSGPIQVFLVETIGYVIGWFAFPFAMLYVADKLDRGERYFRYIAAANWAAVLQVGLMLVIVAVEYGFRLSLATVGFVHFITMIVVLVYFWFIARVGLEISGRAAAAIVGLDLGLGLVINSVTMALH